MPSLTRLLGLKLDFLENSAHSSLHCRLLNRLGFAVLLNKDRDGFNYRFQDRDFRAGGA